MRWQGPYVALLLALPVTSLASEAPPEADRSANLRSSEAPGFSLIEAVLPGPLVEVEPFRSPSGDRSLILLVEAGEDSGAPRFVYELRFEDSARLSDLPVVLPPEADSIASVDLSGDGARELLVGEPGRIFRLTGEGKLELAVEGQDVNLKARARLGPGGATPDDDDLILGSVGRVERFSSEAGEGHLRRVEAFRIPVEARLQGDWLRLSSSLVSAVPRRDASRRYTYLVGPEAVGDRRLRTLVLEIDGDLDGSVGERWSQLPSPEAVEESLYASLDGEIVLLVTTVQADKRGIFEKEKLRVLGLLEDRSRAGATPILELVSRTRNWYRAGMGVHDVNVDGSDDVVLVQPKGLGGGKLVVEAFMGVGSGEFAKRARRTNLEVETELWSYGEDLNLDGYPDLVLVENGILFVFLGVGDSESELVVRENPTWRIPIGEIDDRLRVLDVQGDERPEILLFEGRGTDFETDEAEEGEEPDSPSDGKERTARGRLSLVTLSDPGQE
jgi:hypothetical protein